jgi:hypothetical protein
MPSLINKKYNMKKIYITFSGLFVLAFMLSSGINGVKSINSNNGISGYTITGCNCHNLQSGAVDLLNMPTTVLKNTLYTFNLKYTPTTSYAYYGFDLKASAGTLSAGTGMKLKTGELTHTAPYGGTVAPSYTFTGLKWTAPATAQAVTFTYACVAGASTNTTSGPWQKGSTTTSVVLPVELINFSVEKNNNKVNISWQTATEINSNYFEVEKSFNGKEFSVITKINAAGNSSNTQKYNTTDELANTAAIIYYRIKTMDKDGSFGYSSIQSINVKTNTNLISIYPNPVKKGQAVSIELNSDKTQNISFVLITNEGKIISEKVKNIVRGYNRVSLQFNNFIPVGNYFLQAKINNVLLSPTKIIITD